LIKINIKEHFSDVKKGGRGVHSFSVEIAIVHPLIESVFSMVGLQGTKNNWIKEKHIPSEPPLCKRWSFLLNSTTLYPLCTDNFGHREVYPPFPTLIWRLLFKMSQVLKFRFMLKTSKTISPVQMIQCFKRKVFFRPFKPITPSLN